MSVRMAGPGQGTGPDAHVAAGRVHHLLALADDALVASQRLSWWVTRAPELEEDVALANIALDLLGQARSLLTHAGGVEGRGRDEDDLAYWRDEREFRNVCLVERDPGDFAVTMVRMLLLASWQRHLYAALQTSADPVLAAVAEKARKEVDYHQQHAATWVVRLGDGTEESRRRTVAALAAEWPWAHELFDDGWLEPGLVADGTAVLPSTLRAPVVAEVAGVLAAAGLELPDPALHPPKFARGRYGQHTEELGRVLAEMQHLTRSHPGVDW